MDTNQDNNSEERDLATPESVSGVMHEKFRLKALLIVLVVVLSVAVFAYLTVFNKGTEEVTEPSQEELDAQRHAEIVADTWFARGLEATSESMQAYADELSAELTDPTIPEKTKKLLMLRKALALSAIHGEGARAASSEALVILDELYSMEPADEEELRYKNAVIPISLQILKANNYPQSFGELTPGGYDATYYAYLADGYPQKEAVILAFRDFARLAPDEEFANDRSLVTERAYLSALYLYAFGGNDPATDAIYLYQLQEDVGRDNSLDLVLLPGPFKGGVRPVAAQAFAFDIAETFNVDSITKVIQDEIDLGYEQVFTTADLAAGIDTTTRSIVKIENAFNYLDSLHRRYGTAELDTAKVERIIDILARAVPYNETTQQMFRGYLISGKSAVGSWIPMRSNFYEIAEGYPELQELVASYSNSESE